MPKKFPISLIFLIANLLLCVAPLLAQNHDEPLSARFDPAYFSPNGDDMVDQTFFYPVLKTDISPIRWLLDIDDARRHRVVRLSGAGFSALIKWDGRDRKGKIVPDGTYTAQYTIYGRDGKISSKPVPVVVDTIGPYVNVAVSTPVLDGTSMHGSPLIFTPTVTDSSPIDRYQLQILDVTGRTVYVAWSTAELAPMTWDGHDHKTDSLVPQGRYKCAFEVWDKAGVKSAPAFVDVAVTISAKELLQNGIRHITYSNTDTGIITQLSARDLFTMQNQKPQLKDGAEQFLKEVALLINAYPDVPVQLNGYAPAQKKMALQNDNSSLYAWTVYSYLVKTGNVKASRLTVRGRGATPAPERLRINPPVIKDGVEVVLMGTWE